MKWHLFFAVFFLAAPTLFISTSSQSRVSRLVCQTPYGPCPPHFLDSLHPLLGQPLFQVGLPRPIPEVLSSTIHPEFPSTLKLSIQLRSPQGLVGTPGQLFISDSRGFLYSPSTFPSTLPVLLVPSPLHLGQVLSSSQLTSLLVLAHLPPYKSRAYGYLTDQSLIILAGGTEIILNPSNPNPVWASSLQAVFTRSKINSQIPKRVDLRPQNPIVVY